MNFSLDDNHLVDVAQNLILMKSFHLKSPALGSLTPQLVNVQLDTQKNYPTHHQMFFHSVARILVDWFGAVGKNLKRVVTCSI